MTRRDDWIRERANLLREEAGRPDDPNGNYWEQANAEWEAGVRTTQTNLGCAKLVQEIGANTAKLTPT